MTTTVISSNAARVASQIKRNRAAQRPSDNYDTLGLPELRQLATAQGWGGTVLIEHGTKEEIVSALRRHPSGPPVDRKPNAMDKLVGVVITPAVEAATQNAQKRKPNGADVSRRIAAARESGYSRNDIATAAGLTQSVIWRMQAKSRVKHDEYPAIIDALTRIEAGEVRPTKRGRPASPVRSAKLDAVRGHVTAATETLAAVPQSASKDVVIVRYRTALESALETLKSIEW